MLVINSNIMSLNAQRNLSTSGADLATSLQRLSSGLRINSAKDDAAGLAISERFTTQIRGMDQAARNANDGISLSQTAEGAMAEIGNNLQRIRELAVQSRNATNSTSDREALNAEATQLLAEINRVAEQTSFNGVKLLDGSFSDQVFQVGANQGETISIEQIVNASTAALGAWTSVDTSTYTQTLTAATATDPAIGVAFDVNGVTITTADGAADAAAATAAIKTAFDAAKTANPDALANVAMDAAGAITSTDKSITIANLTNVSGLTAGTTDGTETVVAGSAQTGFEDLDISTAVGADNAMVAMTAALNALNSGRAEMGAIQNRFGSVVANLGSNIENLSAARSRIQDADFAKETALLTRNQILQQAGTAMLAQANQAPQGVLALLR